MGGRGGAGVTAGSRRETPMPPPPPARRSLECPTAAPRPLRGGVRATRPRASSACDRLPAARLTSDPARVCVRPGACPPRPPRSSVRAPGGGGEAAASLPLRHPAAPAGSSAYSPPLGKQINKGGESPAVRGPVRSRVCFGGMTVHLTPRNQVHGQQVCSECKLASFLPAGLEHAPGRGWEHTRVASVTTLTALNLLPLDYYRNRPDK